MITVAPRRNDDGALTRATGIGTRPAVADGRAQAIRLWVRSDVRRRWKALVVLGILAGLTAGLAMGALAGARRTDTALARLRVATNAADAIVFASQTGVPHPDWSALRSRPEVADLAVWDLMFGDQDGEPGGLLFVSHDGAFGDQLTRPVITEGRIWDSAARDEVVITPAIAPFLPVGSTFTFQPFASDQGDNATAPSGPVVTFRVVGVGSTVNRFLFTDGQILVGPGFTAEYGDQVQLAENADVRLGNGSADVAALQRDVNAVVHPGTPLLDLNAVSRRVDTTIGVEITALMLLAAVVAIAGGLLVGQALGRSASTIGDDGPALRALGMSRREMIAATVISHVVVAVVAAVVSVTGGVAVSRYFPVGLGRQIDPSVGTHADLVVIVPGAVLVVALLLIGAALLSRRAAGNQRTELLRPSVLVAVIRTISPVTVGLGAAMALEPGAGRTRVSVRPALIGAIIGVLGVVGALTIEHSVEDALAHPERAGVTWEAQVDPLLSDYGEHGLSPDVLAKIAAAVPVGTGITEVARLSAQVDGVGVPTFMALPYGRPPAPEFSVIGGRAPERDNEVAIGPKTAADLGVEIGDTVSVGVARLPATVVGTALFPSDVHAEFDEGLWLTPGRFDAVSPVADEAHLFEGPARGIFLAFPAVTDAGSAIAQTEQALGAGVQSVTAAELPVELTNLRNVRTLPWVLAVFLALLAAAAVSHVLVSSSHRRRRDLAVLRAMGFTRRSSRRAVNAQATVIALVGLLAGIPLGIAVGRIGWRLVAERVPLQDVTPVPALAVLIVVPAALLLMNVLAVVPARSVARLRPAETLREE